MTLKTGRRRHEGFDMRGVFSRLRVGLAICICVKLLLLLYPLNETRLSLRNHYRISLTNKYYLQMGSVLVIDHTETK